jgi:hypothetical protein
MQVALKWRCCDSKELLSNYFVIRINYAVISEHIKDGTAIQNDFINLFRKTSSLFDDRKLSVHAPLTFPENGSDGEYPWRKLVYRKYV